MLALLLSPSSCASSSLVIPLLLPHTKQPFLCFFLSSDILSFSSASSPTWLMYGLVPMTRYTKCPCIAPLKRLTSKKHKNGNFGREFIKCESKPEGQVRSKFFSHPLSLISTNFYHIWDLGFMISFSDREEMLPF
jgi:hypothetical protein